MHFYVQIKKIEKTAVQSRMDNPDKPDCIEHSRDTGQRQTALKKNTTQKTKNIRNTNPTKIV